MTYCILRHLCQLDSYSTAVLLTYCGVVLQIMYIIVLKSILAHKASTLEASTPEAWIWGVYSKDLMKMMYIYNDGKERGRLVIEYQSLETKVWSCRAQA